MLFNLYIELGVLLVCQFNFAFGGQFITCGSVTKLFNPHYGIRLHSHDVKYGSGSGQQSVTGTTVQEDHNSNWFIKGNSTNHCIRGEPIACGQTIRLEHLSTQANLHSHLFRSPLSDQQEISAFGVVGDGDTGDNWEVVCNGQFWLRDNPITFRHCDTKMYLAVSGHQFGRPISGQKEIVGSHSSGSKSEWKTMEGIFVEPSEKPKQKSHPQHTEL